MNPSVSASRQSGLQSSAQSQHHLGASFSLAQGHYIDIIHVHPNNLKLVSTIRGEDQTDNEAAALEFSAGQRGLAGDLMPTKVSYPTYSVGGSVFNFVG